MNDSNTVQADEDFTFFIIDLYDKPGFDTRRRGDSNDDPTKGQFINSCGFVLEIHDSVISDLLQRLDSYLEIRHLQGILHKDVATLRFEHDPDVQQQNMNRRNKLRVRIIHDPVKAKQMTLEDLKYREFGSLPNIKNWRTGEEIDVQDVWRHGVDRSVVDDPDECCGLPQHKAFFEILEGRISPATHPLDDILAGYDEESSRVVSSIVDVVLYDRSGGYEVDGIVGYFTIKTDLSYEMVNPDSE